MDVLGNVADKIGVSEHPAECRSVKLGGMPTGKAVTCQDVFVVEVPKCRYSCRSHKNIRRTNIFDAKAFSAPTVACAEPELNLTTRAAARQRAVPDQPAAVS